MWVIFSGSYESIVHESLFTSLLTQSTYGQMIIAPTRSLVTSIYERVSRSLRFLQGFQHQLLPGFCYTET